MLVLFIRKQLNMEIVQDQQREQRVLKTTQFLTRLRKYQKSKVKGTDIADIKNPSVDTNLKIITFSEFITQITYLIANSFKLKTDLVIKAKLYISPQNTVFCHYLIVRQKQKQLFDQIYFHQVKVEQDCFNSKHKKIGICQHQGIYYRFQNNKDDTLFHVAIQATYKFFYNKFSRFLPKQKTHYVYEPLHTISNLKLMGQRQFIRLLEQLQLFKKHSLYLKIDQYNFLMNIHLSLDCIKYFKSRLAIESNFFTQIKMPAGDKLFKSNNKTTQNLIASSSKMSTELKITQMSTEMKNIQMSTEMKKIGNQQVKIKILILISKGNYINQTFSKACQNRYIINFVPISIQQSKISTQIKRVMQQLYENSQKKTKPTQDLPKKLIHNQEQASQSSQIPIFSIQYYFHTSENTIDQNQNRSSQIFEGNGKNPIINGNWLIVSKTSFEQGIKQQKIHYFIQLVLITPFKIEPLNYQHLLKAWYDSQTYGNLFYYTKQNKKVQIKRRVFFQSLNCLYQKLVQGIDLLMISYLNFQQMLARAEKKKDLFQEQGEKICLDTLDSEELPILCKRLAHYEQIYQLIKNSFNKKLNLV